MAAAQGSNVSVWSSTPGKRIASAVMLVIMLVGGASASTTTYVYDEHGRLKSATRNDSTSVTYTLDAASNRTGIVTYLDTSPPNVPTGLSGSAQSATRINLTWNAASDVGQAGVAGYHVYRNGAWLASPGNVTSYSDTMVVGSSSYVYRVAAYDLRGNTSGQSNPITVATPDVTPPSMPLGFSATAAAWNRVNLSWNAATDSGGAGLAGYRIYRGGTHIATTSALSHADTTVVGSTTYSYAVAAYDNATPPNVSAPSTSATVTTPQAPDTLAPSMPANFSATPINSGQVNLSWSPSTDTGGSGLAGYRVYRNNALVTNTSATGYSDTGLTGTTTYSYFVRAYDAAQNESAPTSTISVTTPDTIAPSAPGGLSASAVSPTQVNLSWAAASDSGGSGLAGYRVYRGGAHIANTSSTSYADTGAAAGTTHSYTVAAYDNANNTSAQSSPVNVTTYAAITISDMSFTEQSSAGATATYQLSAAGDIMRSASSIGSPTLDAGDWLAPKAGMSNFQALGTHLSGAHCLGGTFGSWLSLGSSAPTWSARVGNTSAFTTGHCQFRIDIRNAATGAVVGAATIYLTVVDTPP